MKGRKKGGKGGSGRESVKKDKKKPQLTFPLRASAVFDVGSDTFERFGPESYLPSEDKTEEGSVDDTFEKRSFGAQSYISPLLQKKK